MSGYVPVMGNHDSRHDSHHESKHEPETGITDDDLPEELRPTEDNPLAKPLDEDEAKSPEELDMHGGKTPESDEPDADSEEG